MRNRITLGIAAVLRDIGSQVCLEKAKSLEANSNQLTILNLRSLALNSSDMVSISNILKQENDDHSIQSISFSYNRLIGDEGTIAFANNLPQSIFEIGLVDCGISDIGGLELLRKIKELPNLRMICVENNIFSEKLRKEFRLFSQKNSQILVVV